MKSKSIFIILIAIILFSFSAMIGSFLIRGFKSWRDMNFICDANLNVHQKDMNLTVIISYYINNNSGYTMIKGKLNKNGHIYYVSRKNTFKFHKNQNLIFAESISVDKSPGDNAESADLERILPPFYIIKNKKFEFSIYHQGWNGYIFSTGYVPSFYCNRYNYKERG